MSDKSVSVAGKNVPKWLVYAGGAVVVAGVGYAGYKVATGAGLGKKKKVDLKVIVEKTHVAWLEQMKAKYELESVPKALRVVLEYAIVEGDETVIFDQIRCNTCGGNKDKVPADVTIDAAHIAFLTKMAAKHNISDGFNKAVRVVLEFAKSEEADEAKIFTQIRCRGECK